MNFESMQRFTNAKATDKAEQEKAQAETNARARENARLWLEEHQLFKDLLPSPEHFEQYKRCRDFLILKRIANKVGRGDYFSADWAKGYMDGINTILDIVNEYNQKREQYRI